MSVLATIGLPIIVEDPNSIPSRLGVLGETGKQLKRLGGIHEIACPSEKILFVAELLN